MRSRGLCTGGKAAVGLRSSQSGRERIFLLWNSKHSFDDLFCTFFMFISTQSIERMGRRSKNLTSLSTRTSKSEQELQVYADVTDLP